MNQRILCLVIHHIRPLPGEEHQRNQALIAEKENLRKELEEYSNTMTDRMEIMKQKFMDNQNAFLNAMHKRLSGSFDTGSVYEMFSFLNKYYRKMKR